MFTLIAYIFKIIISLGVGYIIGYSHKDRKSITEIQLNTTLASFFSTCIVGVLYIMTDFNVLVVAIIFFTISRFMIDVTSSFTNIGKNQVLFSIINGILIGMGYVLFSIIIVLLFSYLINNYNVISEFIIKKDISEKEDIDKDKNALDFSNEDL